jgi:hypothetical protein
MACSSPSTMDNNLAEQILAFTSMQMQLLANLKAEWGDLGGEFWDDDEACIQQEMGDDVYLRISSDCLHAMGTSLLGIGGIASNSHYGSRGQYNNIPKCTEFFETALQWPDRMFRHSFRLALVCMLLLQ